MGEHQRLRELILGPELAELDAQSDRVAELEARQAALPQQLPELLQQAQRGDGRRRLGLALSAPVADALVEAVQTQPRSIVEALFPVIGPAIRKAIAEALRDFNENFNRALESSFTPRGLRWRLESWRTGLPYSQVVMRRALRFRLDHVFLIDAASGLVLARASAADLPDLDADAIAGMLTAIGDFVRDSVGSGEDGTLESARVGEHLVWLLPGPRANLAAFVRGAPPAALRTRLQERLERIHGGLAESQQGLQAGAADIDLAFQDTLRLEAIESAVLADLSAAQAAPPRRWPLVLLGVVALALLGWWEWGQWQAQRQRSAVQERLQAWPGLHLEGVTAEAGRLRVSGLIDRDAEPPRAAIAALLPAGIALELDLRGYVSADDAIVLRRAQRQLAPPPAVALQVRDGVLALSGHADAAWAAQAATQAGWIAGVARVDASALQIAADPPQAALRAEWERLRRELPQQRIAFLRDTEPRDEAALAAVLTAAMRLRELAAQLQQPLRLACRGHNDEPGTATTNLQLRTRRAQWLCARLQQAGLDAGQLQAEAGDAAQPRMDERAASLHPLNLPESP